MANLQVNYTFSRAYKDQNTAYWEQGREKGANQVEDGPKSVRNNA